MRQFSQQIENVTGIDTPPGEHIHMRHEHVAGAAHAQQDLAPLSHNDQGGGVAWPQKLNCSAENVFAVVSSTSGVG